MGQQLQFNIYNNMKNFFNKLKGIKDMMNFLDALKGYRTIIINSLMMLVAIIDFLVGNGIVANNSYVAVGFMAIVNTILRFVTDSPIFNDGKNKK